MWHVWLGRRNFGINVVGQYGAKGALYVHGEGTSLEETRGAVKERRNDFAHRETSLLMLVECFDGVYKIAWGAKSSPELQRDYSWHAVEALVPIKAETVEGRAI